MRRNTSHGHDACPPMPQFDVAKSRSSDCDLDTVTTTSSRESHVILRELNLRIPVETNIKLPSYAIEIKEIRKNVHLTECKVVQEANNRNSATLYVEGFVHKNIQYIEKANGYMKDYNVNVPFRCYDRVTFQRNALSPNISNKNATNDELRELAKNGMEADRCGFGSVTFENYNEPIKCKVIYSTVDQWDIKRNFDRWSRFNKLTEKMTVGLRLRLTQLQPTVTVGLPLLAQENEGDTTENVNQTPEE